MSEGIALDVRQRVLDETRAVLVLLQAGNSGGEAMRDLGILEGVVQIRPGCIKVRRRGQRTHIHSSDRPASSSVSTCRTTLPLRPVSPKFDPAPFSIYTKK